MLYKSKIKYCIFCNIVLYYNLYIYVRRLFMTIHNITDGVRLVSVQTEKFKTGSVIFTLATPLDGNISAKAILPFLLHRRCRKYPDFSAFNGILDELYGAGVCAYVTKKGEALLLNIALNAIDDRFSLDGGKVTAQCIELLTDLVFDPIVEDGAFPTDIVEEEKRLLIEKLEAEKNNKRLYALLKCEEIMFANEAYGRHRYGTVESIKELTGKDIYAEWRNLIKTAQMQITMVGSSAPEFVRDILKKKFSRVKREVAPCETEFLPGYPKPNYVSETQNVKQGKLVMGFRTGMRNHDDNLEAMIVAVDIFGGGTYSKLFSVVREKMSLCYYCSAVLNSNKGVVMLQSGIENENEEKAKNEILNQLKEVAAGNFSDDDFSASIKSICDGTLSYNDTPEGLCAWYHASIFRENPLTPEERIEKIRKVDRNQVIRAAKTIMLDTVFMLRGNKDGEEAEDDED